MLDWIAVVSENKPLEYFAKPATLFLLILWTAQHETASWWLLAALWCSLFGDIFLMLPFDAFLPGLGSFLVGHLAYLGAFSVPWTSRLSWLVAVLVLCSPLVRRLLTAVPAEMRGAVAVYVVAVTAMGATALATGWPTAMVGGVLFMASDLMIGWSRFVQNFAGARLAIIVTYHVGQLLLATALTRGG